MVRVVFVLLVALLGDLGFTAYKSFASAAASSPVVRLGQGWDAQQEQRFYYHSQGTVILPASWLAALEAKDGTPLMTPAHMRKLGFIYDDRGSAANPNRWPIGFAIDKDGRTGPVPTVGITCAACHTGEYTFRGTRVRVDGGQSHIDLDAFKDVVSDAIVATGANPARRIAFERKAVSLGFPAAQMHQQFETQYDAVVKSKPGRAALLASGTPGGAGRTDAFAVAAQVIFNRAIGMPTNINKATAPVDYPVLWNIWNLNWVQYNGSIRQPMTRNVGEALGVGALAQFIDPHTGQLLPAPGRWRTSIRVRDLNAIEDLIVALQSPKWPSATFGAADPARAEAGRTLFGQNCAACHAVRAIAHSKNDEWSVRVIPLEYIGTDPRQADNFRLTTYDARKLGLSAKTTIAVGARFVASGVRDQAYIDEHVSPAQRPSFDGFGRPDTVTSPCGYRARPLVGMWASAPFLHNGSVPTVFDLLSDERPRHFHMGSTQYDPKHLGLADATTGTVFDTTLAGNSNAGHWFTDDTKRAGRIGHALSDDQKYAIVEYLKGATYADYPRVTVAHADPLPCVK